MSRSCWKPNYIHPQIVNAITSTDKNESADLILFNRSTILTEELIGYNFVVYNGNKFFSFIVDSDKIGHRIGEFAPTKKKPILKKKKK